MKSWNQRCTLPAKSHVGTPKVGNNGTSGACGNEIGIANLQTKTINLSWRLMPYSLSMGAYGGNLRWFNV